jgi:(R,R)-butanediol dehydrogenase / meso-butanediol dehydrogenase / diacetyl reductase
VDGFEVGEQVVVRPLDNRGETPADRGVSHICAGLKFIGIDSPGAFQESWTVPAFTLHKLPKGVDLKLAALAEPLAVACHDVQRAGLKQGELAIVMGGGPIGLLVALVARHHGAEVIVSEINQERITFAKEQLGLEAINPLDTDLVALVKNRSNGTGADVVFEVSGAKQAALAMTEPLALRGRVVLVAVYPQPVEVNLFHFFWKELSLIGARVYEPEDYEEALGILASGSLPLEKMITCVVPLDKIQSAFESCDRQESGIKTLVDCRADRNH